jgi:hypothetical protein
VTESILCARKKSKMTKAAKSNNSAERLCFFADSDFQRAVLKLLRKLEGKGPVFSAR